MPFIALVVLMLFCASIAAFCFMYHCIEQPKDKLPLKCGTRLAIVVCLMGAWLYGSAIMQCENTVTTAFYNIETVTFNDGSKQQFIHWTDGTTSPLTTCVHVTGLVPDGCKLKATIQDNYALGLRWVNTPVTRYEVFRPQSKE